MRTFRQQPRGSAIFLAMVMIIGALALLMGVMTISTQNVTKHEQYSDREKSFLAAQGMLKTAFTDIWEPLREKPALLGDDSLSASIPSSSSGGDWTPLIAPQPPAAPVPYAGRRVGDCYISSVSARWYKSNKNTGANAAVPIARFYFSIRVIAQRTPLGQTNPDGTPFHLPGDVPAVVIETYELNQSSKSPVAQYVELAKNVSCSLCHTSFDNVFNYFNNKAYTALKDPTNIHLPPDSGAAGIADATAKFGTFGRAKVASLGNFQMRDNAGPGNLGTASPDWPRFFPSDSSLNGTFYSRGQVQNQIGAPISGSSIDPLAMKSVQFGSFNTVDTIAGINIYQDPANWTKATDGMNFVSMSPAAVSNGIPAKWQNLYLQYPTDPSKMSDGQVPLDFPFPFADVSNNKLVTDVAVTQKLTDNNSNKATGTTTPNITGSIKGGLAMVVAKGTQFTDTKLPLPTDPRLGDSSVANTTPGVVNGNLILIGTKDNPVNIDQQTIVKGDIIIKGYYTGVGSLWAQGNVYIPSDLQYKNQPLMDSAGNPLFDTNGAPLEDFGKASGTHTVTDPVNGKTSTQANENLGGMVAGGTIIIGDYLTASASDNGLIANPNGGMQVRGYGNTPAQQLSNQATVPLIGTPLFQSNSYVSNQPPDATSYYGNANARENGFPLLPTYQRADPTATYNYWQMDMTGSSSPSDGMYVQKSATLSTKNFTLSQAEIFNRDQWAKTQQVLPGVDGTFDQSNSTYDPAFVPRYYVMNRGDPVNAFVFSKQSSNPSGNATQQAYYSADTAARKDHNGGAAGTYWDDTDQSFKGNENSKLWDTLTVGGATMDYSAVAGGGAPAPLPVGTGSMVEGKATHLVYAPVDPTKPMDPVTNPTGNVLIDSTDSTKAQKAAVIPLNPDWVPTDKMWSILLNEEWSRKSHDTASQAVYSGSGDTPTMTNRDGTPFRIDGMLYTNNAIFGIQRNRTLAQQAAGDYQNAVQTVVDPVTHQQKAALDGAGKPIPYTPDPTQPGPWQTLPPSVSSPNDYWQVTELQDVWSRTTSYDNYTYLKDVDNYSGTSHIDHYTRNANVDHYTENQYVDNYTRNAYTDHYTENQYTDNYTRNAYTDHYTQNQNTDHYTRTAYTDHYTENQYKDNYSQNQNTDHYTQTQYTDHYTKTTTTDVYRQTPYTQTTRTWHCNKSTSYGEAYSGDVVQVNPPTTFAQPTQCNGAAVSSATYTDATTTISPTGTVSVIEPAVPPAGYTVLVSSTPVTTTSVSAMYTGAAPAVPAGWTKSSTTTATITSVSAVYTTPQPAVPAGFTLASTSTVTATSTSATYTGAAPSVPAGWTKTSTTTTTITSVSATYFGPPAPTVPVGFTLASTSSVTQTSTSAVYTGSAPTPPAGWTVASTSTVTATSVSAVYFGPPAPTAPVGWTFSSTTTATQTSTSSPYTGAPPTPPAGWTKTTTTTTTLTSVSPTYYTAPPYTPAPAGWTFVNTTTVTQSSTSSPYTGAAPTPPAGWTKTTTSTSTLTSVSPTYYTTPPYTPAPVGWTFVNTTVTTQTTTTAAYLLPPAPAAPTPGYTFVNTTTSTVTSTSSPYVNGTAAPAVPAGYSLTSTTKTTTTTQSVAYYNGVGEPAVPTGYTMTSTTTTTTTQTLPSGSPYPTDPSSGQYVYYKGNAQPAGPGGYVFSSTSAGTTVTIKLPKPSTKPSPLAISVPPPPSDAAYAYNTGSAPGQSSSDFRMYAKEQESSSRGRLLVNGAVMAPDLGLLVTGRKDPTGKYPSNLILNYDNRVVRLLSLPNTTKFPWQISRVGWVRIDPESTQ